MEGVTTREVWALLTICLGLVFVGLPIWKLFWLAERFVVAVEQGKSITKGLVSRD